MDDWINLLLFFIPNLVGLSVVGLRNADGLGTVTRFK